MSTAVVEPSAARRRLEPGRPARWARLVLLVGWLVAVVLAMVLGERQTSFRVLEDAVGSGSVHEVRVEGGLGAGSHGFSTVTVHWRDGIVRHRTEVIEARPRRQAPPPRRRDGTPVVTGDVAQRLEALQPGLHAERVPITYPGLEGELLGWRVTGWLVLLQLGLVVATAGLLVASPEPWRATRWAWFWLMVLSSPLGVPAYLLLSGPTPLLPAPRRPGRRLTGGLALLLAWVLHEVLHGT